MITNKGDDLKITLQESNIQKVRVFTTDINKYIEKIPKDNVVNISAAELINSELKSGVIAYVAAKSSADNGFEDGKFDTTNVEYTDIYYKDINESFSTPEDEATKEYSDQLEAIKKDLTNKLSNKAEQKDLSNEVSDRKKADAELEESLGQILELFVNSATNEFNAKAEKKDLTDETTTRKAKDEELQRQLNDLQDTTSSINTKLNSKAEQTNLANEVSDRKKADDDLQKKISQLQNKVQIDIEDKLYSKIDRADFEKANSSKTDNSDLIKETTERKANDTQIQNNIESCINNIMFYASSDQSFDDFLSSHNLKKYYAYSTSKDGIENFSTTPFDNYSFIGAYIGNKDNEQPIEYAKYNWKAASKKEHTAYLSLGETICWEEDSFTLDKQTVVAYINYNDKIVVKKLEPGTYKTDDTTIVKSITFSTDFLGSAEYVGVYYDYSDNISEDPTSYHWSSIQEFSPFFNLALQTSDEWSGWIDIGDFNTFNYTFGKNVQLCNTVEKDRNITFSIEIELKDYDITEDDSKQPKLILQGGNNGITSFDLGKALGDKIQARDGVYYIKQTMKAIRASDIFKFQIMLDYCIAKFRYRKLKVEYGTQPTPYIKNALDLPKKYTLSVKSGIDSYIAVDGKKLCVINDAGISIFAIRYASQPQIVYGCSSIYPHEAQAKFSKVSSYFDDCVIVVVGREKFYNNYIFDEPFEPYGIDLSDGRLYNMPNKKASMVFICQKGMNKGEAYYLLDENNPVEFTAQVNYGKLEENKNSNGKNIFFNK